MHTLPHKTINTHILRPAKHLLEPARDINSQLPSTLKLTIIQTQRQTGF